MALAGGSVLNGQGRNLTAAHRFNGNGEGFGFDALSFHGMQHHAVTLAVDSEGPAGHGWATTGGEQPEVIDPVIRNWLENSGHQQNMALLPLVKSLYLGLRRGVGRYPRHVPRFWVIPAG